MLHSSPECDASCPSLRAATGNPRSATQVDGVAVIRCFSSSSIFPSWLSQTLIVNPQRMAAVTSIVSVSSPQLSPFGTRAAARFLPLRSRQSEAISAPAIIRRRPIRRALSRCHAEEWPTREAWVCICRESLPRSARRPWRTSTARDSPYIGTMYDVIVKRQQLTCFPILEASSRDETRSFAGYKGSCLGNPQRRSACHGPRHNPQDTW